MSSKKKERYSDCQALNERVLKEAPHSGEYLFDYRLENIKKEFSNMSENDLLQKMKLYFRNLPISSESLKALTKRNFIKLTEVQRCTIPHALAGRDVMVASKTGSGKTLSYILPVVENLYRKKWTTFDQIGALVLVPTRELAIQVFEVLRSLLTDYHELSFGLITGGKNINIEQSQIAQMNILVCTPGRLLQHITETELFSLDSLQMLILDEADEILSMGFSQTLTQILNAVPRKTQTMLFSATLSKKILSLSKIALNNPEQIFLHDKDSIKHNNKSDIANVYEAPTNLSQYAMIIPHEEKIDVLFSFIKSHRFSKIIVFVSCCKQARFIYEAFKKLRIGLPMFELQARQKQGKRMAIYFTFTESKFGVLVCTNIAARGLDFPKVDWIVQFDIPENVEIYVHRIGRTARFQASGKSLVFVDPSEKVFLNQVEDHRLKVSMISPNPAKQLTIQKSLQILCSEINDLKYLAQRAVISFVRSIDLMSDKSVFDVRKINLQKLSESLGLIQTPVIKFDGDDIEKGKDEASIIEKPQNSLPSEQPLKLNKNQRKLLKFKEKLKTKKGIRATMPEIVDTKNINSQLNMTRETQLISRVEGVIEQYDSDENQDFLSLRKRSEAFPINELENENSKINKKKHKKIKLNIVSNGENVFEIEDDGFISSHSDRIAKQFKNNLAELEKANINLADVYATKLTQNDEDDKTNAMERLKLQREKKRKSMKANKEEIRQRKIEDFSK